MAVELPPGVENDINDVLGVTAEICSSGDVWGGYIACGVHVAIVPACFAMTHRLKQAFPVPMHVWNRLEPAAAPGGWWGTEPGTVQCVAPS